MDTVNIDNLFVNLTNDMTIYIWTNFNRIYITLKTSIFCYLSLSFLTVLGGVGLINRKKVIKKIIFNSGY